MRRLARTFSSLLLLGEQAALDDDLEVGAAGVSGLGHGRDVGAHHVVVAGLELADVDDLLLLGEQAALDDDLEVGAAGVSGLGHGRDVGAHHVVVAGLELADVDDHVDLACTGGHHVGSLGGLGGGGHGAQRAMTAQVMTSVPSSAAATRGTQ